MKRKSRSPISIWKKGWKSEQTIPIKHQNEPRKRGGRDYMLEGKTPKENAQRAKQHKKNNIKDTTAKGVRPRRHY